MSSPAGWYLQPDGQQRYWDGEQWTEHFAPGGRPATTGAVNAVGKPSRPWFKKKRVLIPAGLVAMFVVAGIAGGGTSPTEVTLTAANTQTTAPAVDTAASEKAAADLASEKAAADKAEADKTEADKTAADKAAADKAAADKAAADKAAADKAAAAKVVADKAAADKAAAARAKAAILTVKNNKDLAALLAGTDDCSKTIEGFAAKYSGRTIEFDGNIAYMNNHGDNKTRYDILVNAGDYSETSAIGPSFQFKDVNIVYDLHLTGSNIPDSVGTGDNLHIIAQVEDYNSTQCLFFLEPISTRVR